MRYSRRLLLKNRMIVSLVDKFVCNIHVGSPRPFYWTFTCMREMVDEICFIEISRTSVISLTRYFIDFLRSSVEWSTRPFTLKFRICVLNGRQDLLH